MKKLAVRHAAEKDAEKIYRLGMTTRDFAVSRHIKFYQKDEIAEWIRNKENNILIVAEVNSRIVGFVYCKIMSHHWAMVDNFYVLPKFRKEGVGTSVEEVLLAELRRRNVRYITLLVKPENKIMRRFLRKRGFGEQGQYVWVDKLLRSEDA